jgi:hypothetical protein
MFDPVRNFQRNIQHYTLSLVYPGTLNKLYSLGVGCEVIWEFFLVDASTSAPAYMCTSSLRISLSAWNSDSWLREDFYLSSRQHYILCSFTITTANPTQCKQALDLGLWHVTMGRSQWPRGIRHELSSPVQTLGSWVQIPLEAWMPVCVYSVFVLSSVQISTLRRADPSSEESHRLWKRWGNWKSGQGPTKAVEP